MVDIDITIACDKSIYCAFSPTKTMGTIKIHFGHCVGKYGPGTKLPHILCARIGPLQLGGCACFNKIHTLENNAALDRDSTTRCRLWLGTVPSRVVFILTVRHVIEETVGLASG